LSKEKNDCRATNPAFSPKLKYITEMSSVAYINRLLCDDDIIIGRDFN